MDTPLPSGFFFWLLSPHALFPVIQGTQQPVSSLLVFAWAVLFDGNALLAFFIFFFFFFKAHSCLKTYFRDHLLQNCLPESHAGSAPSPSTRSILPLPPHFVGKLSIFVSLSPPTQVYLGGQTLCLVFHFTHWHAVANHRHLSIFVKLNDEENIQVGDRSRQPV